jgi:NAD-dependent dihydropyrimidine dehydrogenase PreA subunit
MVQLAKPAAARESVGIVSAKDVLNMLVTAREKSCNLCRSAIRACKVKNLLLQAWPRSRFRSLLQR